MATYRFDADNVIVGNGDLIKNGSVVVEGNKITYAGESEHAPTADNIETVTAIMPGMWDCHVHFTGIKTPSLETTVFTNPTVGALRCVWDVNEMVKSGFTSTRDVGGFGIYLDKVISEGAIQGPRIYGAGKVLSTTGGHADIHGINLDVYSLLGSVNDNVLGELADGVPECYRAVRKQLRNGAQLIKYCASGGVISEVDHPIHQQFSNEEQKAIVEEATRAEVAIAAHCHGAPGIKAALEAGVTTIEHGTYLNDELADLMVETDTILVPTRYVIEKLQVGAEKMGVPEYSMIKLRNMYDQHFNAMKLAISKGVKIAVGTDMFTSGPNGIFRFGDNALELKYLVDAGMSPMDAIVAATSNGALTVGIKAQTSGMLRTGFEADLLVLNKNPLDDIEVLTKRDSITHIMKQGNYIN
ncbi:MAG: amidohydrolase family protein [Candidatus Kariarchaeaceae archaeon]|jgi:imidazolonepropionase-like amidohydrolase